MSVKELALDRASISDAIDEKIDEIRLKQPHVANPVAAALVGRVASTP